MSREERAWSYEVPDAALIPTIVQHPLVEDTHQIDRAEGTFSPELPAARAAVRKWYQNPLLAALSATWPLLSGILLLVGVAAAWPAMRASPARALLAGVVAISLALRIALVMSGGQFYWPDEDRYKQSRDMVEALAGGKTQEAWTRAMALGHPLFKALGMLPATIEWKYGRDPRIPAIFFALFGALNVWLLGHAARRFGAGDWESLAAATLFAASTSFLFYARHLFPYDAAMTFGLLALNAAAVPPRRSQDFVESGSSRTPAWLLSGVWAACAFLTYFGYWVFGAAACVICVMGAASWKEGARRAVVVGAGVAVPLLLVALVNASMNGDIVSLLRAFTAQVTQGNVAEGWRLPFEYLWHAEHLLLLVWIAAVGWCVASWPSWRSHRAARAGLIGLVVVYGLLAVLSTGLGTFVVYGRLARQLVPFFCLVSAAVLTRCVLRSPFTRVITAAAGAAIVLVAAFNARSVFAQQFPPDFIARGEQAAGRAGAASAVTLYTEYTYPPVSLDVPPELQELTSAAHPLQFRPYQYEGFTPEQRQFLRSTDMRMRVLVPRRSG